MTGALQAALRLADGFVPVFPCNPATKSPLTPRGFKDATTDAMRIKAWWAENPDALIGVPTGRASDIAVLDIDPRNGGDAWLRENAGTLPATRTVRTRSGGVHLLC